MSLTLEQAIGQKFMLSFEGQEPSSVILSTLQRQHVGGITLFRALNVKDPAQVRALTQALQSAARAAGQPLLLIAADQEGGTLLALPGATPFPGNLALGATRSDDLAYRAGFAIGRELAAMGINVDYAPVCDVNINPQNPVVGPRSFGEDPALVARLGAAMIRGLQVAGVAATAKHFPGHGDTATDSHHGVPILLHDEARLHEVELPPFAAAVQAGVKLVMTAHIALPHFNGGSDLPSTLSPAVLRGLLRGELGFQGLILSDALDMQAIQQGPGLVVDIIAATAAGGDMLMLNGGMSEDGLLYKALLQATQRALLSPAEIIASAERVLALKAWCAQAELPPLEVVGCAEHQALAAEIAERSVTLVRDEAHRLPLRLAPNARIAAIVPTPQDLTPADTSSYETPALAAALRQHHPQVDEFSLPISPTSAEVAALRERVSGYDLVVVGTINATEHPGQAELVNALLAARVPTVAVALRMPYDLSVYPAVPTYLCTYSLQPASLHALARVLWGQIKAQGQLPVSIPDVAAVS